MDPGNFWTGYYTSRSTLKYYERQGNNLLQVAKQLAVKSNVPQKDDLNLLREAMGVLQHHDAVTGTEKQHVAEDYARLLSHASHFSKNLASRSIRYKIIVPNFF